MSKVYSITLFGGPAGGQEMVIPEALHNFGLLRVPVEKASPVHITDDPFPLAANSFAVAVYRPSHYPGRWVFAHLEGEK